MLYVQGVRLAVAMAIENFGGQLECISMVAHCTSGNKIDNTMVVREFMILCVIQKDSGCPIIIGNLIL